MVSLDKAGQANVRPGVTHGENWRMIKLYALIIAAIAVLAAATALAAPRGSGISRCDSIVQQNQYRCIESVAVATGNSTICGSLKGNYADSCYIAIAENTSNPSLCGRIASQNLSGECLLILAQMSNSTETCMMINGQGREGCIYQVALDSGNVSSCALINNSGQQANCSATVYLNRAMAQNNASSCANIPEAGSRNMTYSMLEGSDMADYGNLLLNMSQFIEYVSYSNESVGPRDACYLSIAFMSGNSVYCNSTQGTGIGYMCRSLITKSTTSNVTSLQQNSTSNYTALTGECSAGTNQCTYASDYINAILSDNISACGNIPASRSYQCYFAFAEKYNNTSYCSFIKNSTENSDCVRSVQGAFSNSTP